MPPYRRISFYHGIPIWLKQEVRDFTSIILLDQTCFPTSLFIKTQKNKLFCSFWSRAILQFLFRGLMELLRPCNSQTKPRRCCGAQLRPIWKPQLLCIWGQTAHSGEIKLPEFCMCSKIRCQDYIFFRWAPCRKTNCHFCSELCFFVCC